MAKQIKVREDNYFAVQGWMVTELKLKGNIQSGKLEAVEREVMIPTLKKFVTEEALEKYKAGRAS